MTVLAPERMLPSKLKGHLEANCNTWLAYNFFPRNLKEVKQEKSAFFKNTSTPNDAFIAPYKVAYRTAKCKKPNSVVEELILPAALYMVNIMVCESESFYMLCKVHR